MHKFPRWFIIFSRMPQFSDNCDAVAQAITFERYSVRKTDAAPISPVV